mgnify:CR=1 FL=1
MDIIIYHNPDCGTSRNTLAMIRNAGVEPHVIEYLKTPPSRTMLIQLISRMGISIRELLREKGTPFAELGLGDRKHTNGSLLDAMMAHPILINRPIVVSPMGVKLCRPSQKVLDLLPPQRGAFTKEDGERVVDERGSRIVMPDRPTKITGNSSNSAATRLAESAARRGQSTPIFPLPGSSIHRVLRLIDDLNRC